MKILIIHQYFLEKGGSGGSRFNQFAKYWSANGHEVTVIAGTVDYATGKKNEKYRGKWVAKEKIDGNISVLRCYVSASYNKNFIGRFWAYFSFAISAGWAAIFHADKPDVVIATSPPLFVAIPGYIISRLKQSPLIFELRDLWPKFAIDLGILKNKTIITLAIWTENFIYRKANIINVLTPAFREYLIKEKNVASEKIIYIPNGADLDILLPGPKENWVREKFCWKNKFVVLYVGAHGVANDLWQIIKAAEKLQSNKEIVFALIGDGMEKPKLMEYAKSKNLSNVQFIAPVPKEQIGDYINAADACTATLNPVFTTTYPNKVFDYMSLAKPIILPIDGAVKKMVIDEASAGIFVEPQNTEEFKNAVLELFNDRGKMKIFGDNGYRYVRENFDRQKLAAKYEETILKLVKKKYAPNL